MCVCVFFVKKSGKWGCFVKKSGGPFLNAGCIMYSINIFYFTFYLLERGVRTHPTPLLPTGMVLAHPTAAKPQAGLCAAAVSYFHIV